MRSTLFCLTGPSGAGKSTVAATVGAELADRIVTLEQDVLWSPELADMPDGMVGFRARWLRLAAMIAQHGRPVLLCGTVVPAELEPLPERCLFGEIRYLALTAPSAVLRARLRARPAWRGWDEARIAEMIDFADRLQREGPSWEPALTMVDTSDRSADEVAELVRAWVLAAMRWRDRGSRAGGGPWRGGRVGVGSSAPSQWCSTYRPAARCTAPAGTH
ncbi:MAG: hypothetical protein R2755_17400 [Acidimicrobiales bacterium]